jgi:biopolymer transport protein TolR
MSMDVGGAKGGVKADINVTPLVDVMLVLLIIVMLIAPMLQNQVQVNMPEALNTKDKPDTADQTVVHVDAQSKLYVNGRPFPNQACRRPSRARPTGRSTSRATRTPRTEPSCR